MRNTRIMVKDKVCTQDAAELDVGSKTSVLLQSRRDRATAHTTPMHGASKNCAQTHSRPYAPVQYLDHLYMAQSSMEIRPLTYRARGSRVRVTTPHQKRAVADCLCGCDVRASHTNITLDSRLI